MTTNSSRILVGQIGRVFWMRVEGKGTHLNSLQAKSVFQRIMAKGLYDLVVDLERCPMMDSTFLGMLTGTALNVKKVNKEGTLSVLNANQRNVQLLNSLGLNHILEIDADASMWSSERERAVAALKLCENHDPATKEVQTQHVLDAHQILSDVSSDNECRFRDVIDFLEKELEAHSASPPPA